MICHDMGRYLQWRAMSGVRCEVNAWPSSSVRRKMPHVAAMSCIAKLQTTLDRLLNTIILSALSYGRAATLFSARDSCAATIVSSIYQLGQDVGRRRQQSIRLLPTSRLRDKRHRLPFRS